MVLLGLGLTMVRLSLRARGLRRVRLSRRLMLVVRLLRLRVRLMLMVRLRLFGSVLLLRLAGLLLHIRTRPLRAAPAPAAASALMRLLRLLLSLGSLRYVLGLSVQWLCSSLFTVIPRDDQALKHLPRRRNKM
ncbi:MAG TPA: hypothetical protein P5287_06435 [bacterium]|nr:hypothetical protein [bacterium]